MLAQRDLIKQKELYKWLFIYELYLFSHLKIEAKIHFLWLYVNISWTFWSAFNSIFSIQGYLVYKLPSFHFYF